MHHLLGGDYYYTIVQMTGLDMSTMCTIINEVEKANVNHLWDKCVGQQLSKDEEQYEKKIVGISHDKALLRYKKRQLYSSVN